MNNAERNTIEIDENDKEVAVEDMDDLFQSPGSEEKNEQPESMEEDVIRTRSRRISCSYDHANHFPEISHCQDIYDDKNRRWIKHYYYVNEEMAEKLSFMIHHSESCFNERIVQKSKNTVDVDLPVSKWDNYDQCQLCRKTL